MPLTTDDVRLIDTNGLRARMQFYIQVLYYEEAGPTAIRSIVNQDIPRLLLILVSYGYVRYLIYLYK